MVDHFHTSEHSVSREERQRLLRVEMSLSISVRSALWRCSICKSVKGLDIYLSPLVLPNSGDTRLHGPALMAADGPTGPKDRPPLRRRTFYQEAAGCVKMVTLEYQHKDCDSNDSIAT